MKWGLELSCMAKNPKKKLQKFNMLLNILGDRIS